MKWRVKWALSCTKWIYWNWSQRLRKWGTIMQERDGWRRCMTTMECKENANMWVCTIYYMTRRLNNLSWSISYIINVYHIPVSFWLTPNLQTHFWSNLTISDIRAPVGKKSTNDWQMVSTVCLQHCQYQITRCLTTPSLNPPLVRQSPPSRTLWIGWSQKTRELSPAGTVGRELA